MSEEKKDIKLSAAAQKIFDAVKELSVLDLADLVKALEEEFGVSAAAPMMMAGAPAAGGAGGGEEAEEKSTFDVELTDGGASKIAVIKVVKEITGLGLGEAKALVDGAPKVIKAGVAKADAEKMKADLHAAGATVTLK